MEPLHIRSAEVPPTSKRVVGHGAYFVKVKEGKVVEFSAHPDAAGMMMQLGLIPQP
jgi:predicted ester cyclase